MPSTFCTGVTVDSVVDAGSVSGSILPRWGPFCPDSSSFCPLSKSGQEKGCFGVGLGVFLVCAYQRKAIVTLSKEQGLVVVFWAKLDPIWAK